jgi:SagB-type dehydrogenase family enzyme
VAQPAPPKDAEVTALPKPNKFITTKDHVFECIADRQSRRKYTGQPLSLAELSYLLWATQGVKRHVAGPRVTIRTVPSGGAMHPLETYIAAQRVEGLKPGLYRYLPLDHALALVYAADDLAKRVTEAARDQFDGSCAAVFIWSAVPHRSEWRFVTEAAKLVLLDAGHVCQNLYLACESICCGTCGIGAYDQKKCDTLCRLDGEQELVVYLAPVGKV